MPHFVVDCSQGILASRSEEEILARLHRAVDSTGLFEKDDIKVRVNPFQTYAAGGCTEDFIHVFSYIMQGRTIEQRARLSEKIVSALADMFPTIRRIAANIAEFEKATYVNRAMLDGRGSSYAGA